MEQAIDQAADEQTPQPPAELVPAAQTLETVLVGSVELPASPSHRAALPPVQAAAVAAGGFLAGAAVVGVVGRRRRARKPVARPRRVLRRRAGTDTRQSAAGEVLQIVASRSLLLDVHLLGLPSAER